MRWLLRTLLLLAGLAVLATSVSLWIYRHIPAAQLEAKYALPQSRFVELDGVRMHVVEQSEGPAIVLVHAHYASLRMWDPGPSASHATTASSASTSRATA